MKISLLKSPLIGLCFLSLRKNSIIFKPLLVLFLGIFLLSSQYSLAANKCPTGNSLASTTTQNVCVSGSTATLTANAAMNGQATATTCIYTWYSNTSNSPVSSGGGV